MKKCPKEQGLKGLERECMEGIERKGMNTPECSSHLHTMMMPKICKMI